MTNKFIFISNQWLNCICNMNFTTLSFFLFFQFTKYSSRQNISTYNIGSVMTGPTPWSHSLSVARLANVDLKTDAHTRLCWTSIQDQSILLLTAEASAVWRSPMVHPRNYRNLKSWKSLGCRSPDGARTHNPFRRSFSATFVVKREVQKVAVTKNNHNAAAECSLIH